MKPPADLSRLVARQRAFARAEALLDAIGLVLERLGNLQGPHQAELGPLVSKLADEARAAAALARATAEKEAREAGA